MATVSLTAKEIHIIIQLIRLATDDILDYAKKKDIEQLRTKLQNVKD